MASKVIVLARDRDQSEGTKQALRVYMEHYWGSTQANPIGIGRIYGGALIEAHVWDRHIWLKSVWAIEKRKGFGAKAMQFMCDLADTYGVSVVLTPQKFGAEGMTNLQLKKWYRRFGFVPREGGDMHREPVKKGGRP